MPHDMMYSCEERRFFIENGKKVPRWKVVEVRTLESGGSGSIRCMHCHGRVKVHKQKVTHGPQDHVEHLSHDDSENCKAGMHFSGTHKMSAEPVE